MDKGLEVDLTQKCQHDLEQRKYHEKSAIKLLDKLHGLQERMYTVRYQFDIVSDEIAKEIELTNLAKEILKVEGRISSALNKSFDSFEQQLNLQDLGCEGIFNTVVVVAPPDKNTEEGGGGGKGKGTEEEEEPFGRKPSNKSSSDPFGRKPSHKSSSDPFGRKPSHKKMSAESLLAGGDVGGFMRTASTKTLEGQSPVGMWHSLFKMFKEWKHQSTVAEGQYIATRDPELTELDAEISKLRAAIAQLKQQKQLTTIHQHMLEDFQDQLKMRLAQKERLARAALDNSKIVNLDD